MITDINLLAVKDEINGKVYVSLHHLNFNVESDSRRFCELQSEAETNRILKKYGYRTI